MKHLKLSVLLCFFYQLSFGQSWIQQFLLSSKKKDIQGQSFASLQTYVPISLGNVIGGGTVNFPPTVAQYNYGIFRNIAIGGMIGYSSTTSKEVTTNQILTLAQELLCAADPVTASSLGINCNPTNGSVKYTTNYLLLGASLKYFVEAGRHTDLYGNVSVGYKAGSQKRVSTSTAIPAVNDIINAYNEASKVFVITTMGTHIYLDHNKKYAITGEAGYGYGIGDDIVIGTKSIVISLGATYHFGGRR